MNSRQDSLINEDIQQAKKVLDIEAQAILALKDRLDVLPKAIEILLQCKGKVIVSGIGKSGAIGRKIAATFNSTGTPSFFLHPVEGSHGDLGVISKSDVVLIVSYGGESVELDHLLSYLARKGIPLIAMTGSPESTLGQAADVVLNISVDREACPMGLAPTASSTSSLAIGDALAVALFRRRGFGEKEFAEFHPGGKLGRRLLTRVKDIMHSGAEVPLVSPNVDTRQVIVEMANKETRGVTGVIDDNQNLIGVITDGDIRRLLDRSPNPLNETAGKIMSSQPKTIDCSELAERALFVMEQFRIHLLFVVDRSANNPNRPVGILHLQDLLRAKIR